MVFIGRMHTGFCAWRQTLALGRLDGGVLNSGVAQRPCTEHPSTQHRLPEAEATRHRIAIQALDRWFWSWTDGRVYTGRTPESSLGEYRSFLDLG